LADEALYGLLGEIITEIEPFTEADRPALLAHAISGIGALLGPHAHAIAGDAPHPARFFTALVGETSKGRKGSASKPIERLLTIADPYFADRISEGLSSGEGAIWQVRDAIYRRDRNGEEVLADPGIDDKRLWLIESELASTLRVLGRDGNTLGGIVRKAWDTGTLKSLTKNTPAKATGAHIAITGHVTREELLRYLDRSELVNGFANRFLWFCCKRARPLPDGEQVPEEILSKLAYRMRLVKEWAVTERTLRRDPVAAATWSEVYEELSEGKPGMFGATTNRAEAQVLRLSNLYAVLDCSEAISADHLLAALAVWKYAEQSALWLFGDAIGDPMADQILTALRQGERDRTWLYEVLFAKNAHSAMIGAKLSLLARLGLADMRTDSAEGGRGRPREIWFATGRHRLNPLNTSNTYRVQVTR
jgi:hypothetical protein